MPYCSSGSSRLARGPEPAPPMLRMLPTLPMLRIEPALPMDKIEPALPMLKTLAKLMMLPTLAKLMMLNKLLALSKLARPPLPARFSARSRRERADLCTVTSSVVAALSLTLPRRASLAALPTVPALSPGGVARRSRGLITRTSSSETLGSDAAWPELVHRALLTIMDAG